MFNFSWGWKEYAGMGLGAVGAVVAFPFVLAGLGFTTAGITVGSIAAGMMSLYGGSVAAGSIVAVLQSLGAAGMGYVSTAIVGTLGALLGKEAVDFLENASDDDKSELVTSLAACLMSPYGGKLSPGRTASLLKDWSSKGLDAVTDNEEKAGLIACLMKMADHKHH